MESSEPQALPWEPGLKGAEEKNLFLVPHLCPSARGEGQLDEDKGGFSTGITFGGFPGAGEAPMATGTVYPALTWVGLQTPPGTSLATTEPRAGLPCCHHHQLPQSGGGTGTAPGAGDAWSSLGHVLQGEEGTGAPKLRRSPGMDVPHGCWVPPLTPL